MTTQEHIILFEAIVIGMLTFILLVLRKSLYNHNVKLQEELTEFKKETKYEFDRVRFTEKRICDVGTVYGENFVVTSAKYFESKTSPSFHLYMNYTYELLNLKTKEVLIFKSNSVLAQFLKENDLSISNSNEDKN